MKRKKKRGWFAFFVLSIFITLLVWALAFLLWLFWPELEKFLVERIPSEQTRRTSQEKISEEDRKQLEEILRRR